MFFLFKKYTKQILYSLLIHLTILKEEIIIKKINQSISKNRIIMADLGLRLSLFLFSTPTSPPKKEKIRFYSKNFKIIKINFITCFPTGHISSPWDYTIVSEKS
jgi:hypothetical protein